MVMCGNLCSWMLSMVMLVMQLCRHGLAWSSVVTCVVMHRLLMHAWSCVVMHGHAWSCMVMPRHASSRMAVHGHVWACTHACMPARSCVVMQGHVWSCIVPGHAWSCMVMHGRVGHAWPCVVINPCHALSCMSYTCS